MVNDLETGFKRLKLYALLKNIYNLIIAPVAVIAICLYLVYKVGRSNIQAILLDLLIIAIAGLVFNVSLYTVSMLYIRYKRRYKEFINTTTCHDWKNYYDKVSLFETNTNCKLTKMLNYLQKVLLTLGIISFVIAFSLFVYELVHTSAYHEILSLFLMLSLFCFSFYMFVYIIKAFSGV